MDKQLILAVAGSGKTRLIIDHLSADKRYLIVTYTINNTNNIRHRIITKFGFFPENIRLYTYFTFLFSFCFRPLLGHEIKAKGLFFDRPPQWPKKLSDPGHYIAHNRIYSSRLAKLLINKSITPEISERLMRYFDAIYIDEIQDFAASDFNLLKEISKHSHDLYFVGDFYQHTYDTSSDGSININLHKDLTRFETEYRRMGFQINKTALNKSYRCSPTICKFISENLKIVIESNRTDETIIDIITTQKEADNIFQNNNIIKLFYREHSKFPCYGKNWAESKGEDSHEDVVVVLNKTTEELFTAKKLEQLNPETRNKFYVACSRARRNLYFMSEKLILKYKSTNK